MLLRLGCGAGEGLAGAGGWEDEDGMSEGALSREEQVRKSAVREGLPGPDPASGQCAACLVSPGPFQPCGSELLHCKCR